MMLPSKVTLVDVGPRDGLQNEKQPVDAAVKIELVHRLQAAGLREIEVTSYVSPKWMSALGASFEPKALIETLKGLGARGGALPAYALLYLLSTSALLPSAVLHVVAGAMWGFWGGL